LQKHYASIIYPTHKTKLRYQTGYPFEINPYVAFLKKATYFDPYKTILTKIILPFSFIYEKKTQIRNVILVSKIIEVFS